GRERHADRAPARLPRPQGPEAPRPVGPVPLRPGPHGGAGVEGGRAAAARVLPAREVAQLLGPDTELAWAADSDGRRAAGYDPGVRARRRAGAGAGRRASVTGQRRVTPAEPRTPRPPLAALGRPGLGAPPAGPT